MALHLNLHHEIQKARKLQRRDPLKLAIYAIAGVAGIFAIMYFLQLGRTHSTRQELAAAQAQFATIDPQAKAAKALEDELTIQIKKGEAATRRMEDRFYWASVLDQLARVVPAEVQVTQLTGDVDIAGGHKCTLTLIGIAAGSDPRRVAEDFRTEIAEKLAANYQSVSSTFKNLDDGIDTVLLNGKSTPTATFAISVQLTPGLPAEPANALAKKN